MVEEDGPRDDPAGLYRSQLRREGNRWQLIAEDQALPRTRAPGIVPALENAILILDYINRTPPHVATLAEISSTLAISKSHCHNILKTLAHFGWLRFDGRLKTYELGSGIIAVASSLHGGPVLDRIRAELTRLVLRIGIPSVLAQPLPDDSFVVIDKFNLPNAMEVSFPIGHHFPRDSTANSRAYIAWQSEERIEAWMRGWSPVRYTRSSLLSEGEVRHEIAETRRRGYARSVGEFTEGLMALGMPIFDKQGEVAYVFTCSGLLSNMAPREPVLAQEIIRAAAAINASVLGRVPSGFPVAPTGLPLG
ncbi:IclR family transcriptional regulator [Amaricoccus solimangrovi]|uniref:IclR family transcriptional regulator n=1 Tax=Amaricoccus solimangrovi TaxID=2589815 RepID=A0A501WDT8_9RHOB|nr:IclR family transcriptional regulator [Amaricoccus solimangrovi]TPE48053.1 IclR family transcriptional regulator [Amaricoccus solimangrovi]